MSFIFVFGSNISMEPGRPCSPSSVRARLRAAVKACRARVMPSQQRSLRTRQIASTMLLRPSSDSRNSLAEIQNSDFR